MIHIAQRMSRLGTETAFEVLAKARALEAQGKNIVHLEIGEPDFDTPVNIRTAAKKALDEGFTHYGPAAGLPAVRTAIEQAGATALELNWYTILTDPDVCAAAEEHHLTQTVRELKRILHIPVAVKLSPFFTAFANVAQGLDEVGVDGLVLFNRFYQPDIDIEHLRTSVGPQLSSSDELLLRLRWLAILHGRVNLSLIASVVALDSDHAFFADYPATFKGPGQDLWRVDDGGVDGADGACERQVGEQRA